MLSPLRKTLFVLVGSVALSSLTGCQLAQTVPTHRLIEHQARIDPTGLKEKEINQRAASWIAAEMQRISPQHSTGARHESQPESPTRPAT